MNGELFYDEFKAALTFLNVRWANMHLVTVWAADSRLHFSFNGRTVTVEMAKV